MRCLLKALVLCHGRSLSFSCLPALACCSLPLRSALPMLPCFSLTMTLWLSLWVSSGPRSKSTNQAFDLNKHFLDEHNVKVFIFLSVHEVLENVDKRLLDQRHVRAFTYFRYSQQVKKSDRRLIKEMFVEIESLTGRLFDLLWEPLVLKVHLWARPSVC